MSLSGDIHCITVYIHLTMVQWDTIVGPDQSVDQPNSDFTARDKVTSSVAIFCDLFGWILALR